MPNTNSQTWWRLCNGLGLFHRRRTWGAEKDHRHHKEITIPPDPSTECYTKRNRFSWICFIFQQDNDPKHTSLFMQKLFGGKGERWIPGGNGLATTITRSKPDRVTMGRTGPKSATIGSEI